MTVSNATASNVARAAVEGVLCGLADAIDALAAHGARVGRVRLIGGAAASRAVRLIAPQVFGHPVVVPAPGEYVADGAARQAAWALTGSMPDWKLDAIPDVYESPSTEFVRERYAEARHHWLSSL